MTSASDDIKRDRYNEAISLRDAREASRTMGESSARDETRTCTASEEGQGNKD